ncbi:MEDS domain-containing protein [Streptomyces sclerotialus]|uniref:MEDS domain-containing protein n=1 Tax=Streptomyces sclerotialus TaxID=1957 RepID=UPI0004C521EF
MDASSAVRAVSVTSMTSGDHACLGFDDDASRWELRAAYTEIGLTRGEQVILFTDPVTTPSAAVACLRAGGLRGGTALTNGQLVVYNESPGFDAAVGFVPGKRARLWMELTMRARLQGFAGIRIMADMGWAAGSGTNHDLLVEYERGLSPLFADIGFTAICEYDRRKYDDGLLSRVLRAHPKKVLPRLGALDVTRAGTALQVAGDADVNTRAEFGSAISDALAGPGRPSVIDLTELCFMDVHSASLVVRLASRLPGDQSLEVRCRPAQAKVIRLCGVAKVPQLIVKEGCYAR